MIRRAPSEGSAIRGRGGVGRDVMGVGWAVEDWAVAGQGVGGVCRTCETWKMSELNSLNSLLLLLLLITESESSSHFFRLLQKEEEERSLASDSLTECRWATGHVTTTDNMPTKKLSIDSHHALNVTHGRSGQAPDSSSTVEKVYSVADTVAVCLPPSSPADPNALVSPSFV